MRNRLDLRIPAPMITPAFPPLGCHEAAIAHGQNTHWAGGLSSLRPCAIKPSITHTHRARAILP